MREILFRGQTRRKGEKVRMDGSPVESNWVYGGIFQGPNRSVIYGYDPIEKYCVYSDTVGQFTGLIDKNGKKIFEGDIVTIQNDSPFEMTGCIEFGGGCFELHDHTCDMYECLWYRPEEMEVFGNIYDNPELLEVCNGHFDSN